MYDYTEQSIDISMTLNATALLLIWVSCKSCASITDIRWLTDCARLVVHVECVAVETWTCKAAVCILTLLVAAWSGFDTFVYIYNVHIFIHIDIVFTFPHIHCVNILQCVYMLQHTYLYSFCYPPAVDTRTCTYTWSRSLGRHRFAHSRV